MLLFQWGLFNLGFFFFSLQEVFAELKNFCWNRFEIFIIWIKKCINNVLKKITITSINHNSSNDHNNTIEL